MLGTDPKTLSREDLEKAYISRLELEKQKDTFVSLVSHELRTPLSLIQGYMMLIKELVSGSENSESLNEFIDVVQEAGESLEQTIVSLTSFSSTGGELTPRHRQEVDVPALLALLVENRAALARSRELELNLNLADQAHPVFADQAKLAEAFGRVIDNALQFTPEGGKVEVTYRDNGAEVLVLISDTGIGIPADRLEHIFRPFFQVQDALTREVSGLGLGLTIARHIVADHGGSIEVESVEGEGSTVTILLPKSYQSAEDLLKEFQNRLAAAGSHRVGQVENTEKELMRIAQELSTAYAGEAQRNKEFAQSLREMERTYIQIIAIMVDSLAARDEYAGGHANRVVYYANCIARHYNPVLAQEPLFKYCLLLYDIGKIGVGEEILKKTGGLTGEEWEEMKTHTEIGARLLESVPSLNGALDAVRSHHERWDGKGYPRGLVGDQIPVAARVIALAEAFDAMTTDRPYRKAKTPLEARAEIRDQSGTQFDPRMVDAFEAAWEEISRKLPGAAPLPPAPAPAETKSATAE